MRIVGAIYGGATRAAEYMHKNPTKAAMYGLAAAAAVVGLAAVAGGDYSMCVAQGWCSPLSNCPVVDLTTRALTTTVEATADTVSGASAMTSLAASTALDAVTAAAAKAADTVSGASAMTSLAASTALDAVTAAVDTVVSWVLPKGVAAQQTTALTRVVPFEFPKELAGTSSRGVVAKEDPLNTPKSDATLFVSPAANELQKPSPNNTICLQSEDPNIKLKAPQPEVTEPCMPEALNTNQQSSSIPHGIVACVSFLAAAVFKKMGDWIPART